MRLSEHFTLAEYTASRTAAVLGIDNSVREQSVLDNLKRMAAVMEEIRTLLGAPIIVTSGYRCRPLNSHPSIGGSDTSAHCFGLATDFIAPSYGVPYDVCRAIEPHVERLGIDQLIYEHTWTHVGLTGGTPRHQIKTLATGGGYIAGIVLRGSAG